MGIHPPLGLKLLSIAIHIENFPTSFCVEIDNKYINYEKLKNPSLKEISFLLRTDIIRGTTLIVSIYKNRYLSFSSNKPKPLTGLVDILYSLQRVLSRI
ncbi:hypothetical protein BJL90_21100 [Clostridium formicaceticum]|uniref:Uncharacterized protein n=1 Tax=Clostridium formicaceticum TaxID=1497 RepID=A0ABM6EYH7_9CLOT|nr:hypothetical protein BJL90_21100 [Clostridium formicaceticum]